jgi:hypothetical protein
MADQSTARTAQTVARQTGYLATVMRPEPTRCETRVWSSQGEFMVYSAQCASVMRVVNDIVRNAAGELYANNAYYRCKEVGRGIKCGFVAMSRGGLTVDFDERSRPTKFTMEEYVGDEHYGSSETTMTYND